MSLKSHLLLRRPLAFLGAGLLAAVGITGAGLTGAHQAQAASRAGSLLAPMFGYWNPTLGDNFNAVTYEETRTAQNTGYLLSRQEGWAMQYQEPGSVALLLMWNAARGDYFSTATTVGHTSGIEAGYADLGTQGYVYPYRVAGTVPLYQMWSGARQDNFVTATQAGYNSAVQAGYYVVRIEGYVYPVPGATT